MRRHACSGAVLGLVAPLLAQPCPDPVTLEPNPAALDGEVTAFASFDAGSGARLYAAGSFRHAGAFSVDGAAVWQGDGWAPVPGAPPWPRGSIKVFDDAVGRALYFMGRPGLMYRFDGAAWTTVPIPSKNGEAGAGFSPVVFDPDGAGPLRQSLHLAVRYTGSVDFLRYDGAAWTNLGSPPFGSTPILAGYDDDGPGPHPVELYASSFITRSVGPAMWVDQWLGRYRLGDGWHPILEWSGNGSESYVSAMAVFDPDGSGPVRPVLCAGGHLTVAVIAWDGQTWTGLGDLPGEVTALGSYDPDGAGPARPLLIAGGAFRRPPADGLAAWDGTSWTEFGGGAGPGYVRMGPLREFDEDGPGPLPPSLAVGGTMGQLAGVSVSGFALWRADHWVGVRVHPVGTVHALPIFNDGGGRHLFATGRFDRVGMAPAESVARWDGQAWEAVLPGVQSSAAVPLPTVFASAVYNDGAGWALYFAGDFERAGGAAALNIARWNGQAWSRVGQIGLAGGQVHALEVHDPDGPGPAAARLYAGGAFTSADGHPARGLAMWDGAAWSEVSGGVTGVVRALRSWDDGAGPGLYVGGDPMVAGGLPESVVAKLGSGGWEPIPVPKDAGRVNAFAIHEAGDGQFRLYAAGRFFADGSLVSAIRLDQEGWRSAIDFDAGEGLSARSVVEAGTRTLYLGSAGGMLRWIRGAWYTIDSATGQHVRAITPLFDDGRGDALFVATDPSGPSGGESRLWRLAPCVSCYANCDNSVFTVLNVADFICFQQRFAAGDPWANCDGSAAPPVLNVGDFVCFQQRFAGGCP